MYAMIKQIPIILFVTGKISDKTSAAMKRISDVINDGKRRVNFQSPPEPFGFEKAAEYAKTAHAIEGGIEAPLQFTLQVSHTVH